MAAALAASALSTVLFILAPGIGVLIAARVVSGLSAGLMTGTATAALTELIPASAARRASLVATAANMGGLGLGPLVAGLLAQYAPHPTTLVFEVYLAVLAAAALLLLLVPETVRPRTRSALGFAGLGIPERGRGEFIAAAVAAFAASRCSGCSVPWYPASSGAYCIRAATPSRAASCSACSPWGPSPRPCCRDSAAAGSCWPDWSCSWPRSASSSPPWPSPGWPCSWPARQRAAWPSALSSWAAWPPPAAWPRLGGAARLSRPSS